MNNAQISDGKTHKPSDVRTVTLRLPKVSGLSLQAVILLLLIIVGGLQTVQLFGLKNAIANAKVSPAVSAPSGGSGASGSSLPKMVGGC